MINLFSICWHGNPGCNPSSLQSTILQQPLVMQSLYPLQTPVVWPVPFSPPDPSSLESLKAQLKYHFLLETFFHSPSWTIGMTKDVRVILSSSFYSWLWFQMPFIYKPVQVWPLARAAMINGCVFSTDSSAVLLTRPFLPPFAGSTSEWQVALWVRLWRRQHRAHLSFALHAQSWMDHTVSRVA